MPDCPKRPGADAGGDEIRRDHRCVVPRQSALGDHARDGDEQGEREEQVDRHDPARQSALPQPYPHEQQRAKQRERRGAVGHDLAPVVDAGIAEKGAAEHPVQVAPGRPQAEQHQHHEGAESLQGQDRVGVAAVDPEQGIYALDADGVEHSLLDHAEQVEEPEAEGDVAVDEVGEPDQLEADAELDVDGVAEERQVSPPEGDALDERVVRRQPVVAVDEGGNDETRPHQARG